MHKLNSFLLLLSGAFLINIIACTSTKGYKSLFQQGSLYHSNYDDKTLAIDTASMLMPYNRFIDPAGTVIRFGRTSIENHSLDCILLPDGKTLAVENRYGLALIDIQSKKLSYHLDYDGDYKNVKSTFSGLKAWNDGNTTHIFWGVGNPTSKASYIMEAIWDGKKAVIKDPIQIAPAAPAPMSLPNDLVLQQEGNGMMMYVVLNGNNELIKVRLSDRQQVWKSTTGMAPYGLAIASGKAYVSNWAGAVPSPFDKETAGIPYGKVKIDPRTGATASGTVTVFDLQNGQKLSEIPVGLHPGAVLSSKDQKYIYVANANSDNVSVISTASNTVTETISVKLNQAADLIGDSPNGLALTDDDKTLFVANGLDNALAVISIGKNAATNGRGASSIKGFIPTEAYPAGISVYNGVLYIANLEGEGARVVNKKGFNCHEQEATVSIIPIPMENELKSYTARVEAANLLFRTKLLEMTPRKNIAAKPIPERIGEPSVFKHVVYIIKENKTYDQVLGDMPQGNGLKSLCIFGNEVTPNEHKIASDYLLMDNFYASGKSSAEGHSWTDAAMVTDYVEKNVNAWFRSYPHVLADALVYNKEGFLWNNALDHGKTVRVYGEACTPTWNGNKTWADIYNVYQQKQPFAFTNSTTISRLEPILSPGYPCFENQRVNDQIRADAFIKELQDFEAKHGDQLPELMIIALPADHTAGMREGFPTPRAMVADNDMALGRMIEALTKSRFWDSTAVFVTQDDPQSGWDHVSAYRTTGFVISPYSMLGKTVRTNYNQTCMVRTIEQILGIPPMNILDATALPMFDCFTDKPRNVAYTHLKNQVPLDEMNKPGTSLRGKAKRFTELSALPEFDHIDGGNDDLLNRIIWFSAMGNKKYPRKMTLSKEEQDDDDD